MERAFIVASKKEPQNEREIIKVGEGGVPPKREYIYTYIPWIKNG